MLAETEFNEKRKQIILVSECSGSAGGDRREVDKVDMQIEEGEEKGVDEV